MPSSFEQTLSTRADPLDVLKTTAPVVLHARSVSISTQAIDRAADALIQKDIGPPVWNYDYHFFDGTARSVTYYFLLDTLNFSFWGKPKWGVECKGKKLNGYWALAASLKRAAEDNSRILDADFLADISPQQLGDILRGRSVSSSTLTIPLFAERWRGARELGTVLRERWGGNASRLVESAQGDAARLARLIVENFPSFNDVAVYKFGLRQRGTPKRQERATQSSTHPLAHSLGQVNLFKRAQIVAADLYGAFGGKSWGKFKNIDALTAFADYRLPQILRAWGILKYKPNLANRVDAQVELESGSAEEVEIRAATLWAVEFLREALAARGRILKSFQVDWILWQASQGRHAGMRPYHRVRSVFY